MFKKLLQFVTFPLLLFAGRVAAQQKSPQQPRITPVSDTCSIINIPAKDSLPEHTVKLDTTAKTKQQKKKKPFLPSTLFSGVSLNLSHMQDPLNGIEYPADHQYSLFLSLTEIKARMPLTPSITFTPSVGFDAFQARFIYSGDIEKTAGIVTAHSGYFCVRKFFPARKTFLQQDAYATVTFNLAANRTDSLQRHVSAGIGVYQINNKDGNGRGARVFTSFAENLPHLRLLGRTNVARSVTLDLYAENKQDPAQPHAYTDLGARGTFLVPFNYTAFHRIKIAARCGPSVSYNSRTGLSAGFSFYTQSVARVGKKHKHHR